MKLNLIILITLFSLIVAFRFLTNKPLQSQSSSIKIIGGIVPHHLYVSDIIGRFFSELPQEDIDNVIVLGPNHLELGDTNITYNPDFSDQAITALEPFLKNTFPKSKIIPILLKHKTSLLECTKLASELSKIPGNNLVIASIDFSHYLPSKEAEKHDKAILSMIYNRDYETILRTNSDYLDSPGSLVTSLIYFDQQGANNINLLDNTNSGVRGNPFAGTTSYFSMIFYAQN